MSLKEIREKNRLKDSFIHQKKPTYEGEKLEVPEEDREFYQALKGASARTLSKYLDSEEE